MTMLANRPSNKVSIYKGVLIKYTCCMGEGGQVKDINTLREFDGTYWGNQSMNIAIFSCKMDKTVRFTFG